MTDMRERLMEIGRRWTSVPDTLADAILAAFPELTPPSGSEAVEGAKEVVEKWLGRFVPADDQFGRALPRLEGLIAAFATACVAKERDECAAIAEEVAVSDGWSRFARSAATYITTAIRRRTP